MPCIDHQKPRVANQELKLHNSQSTYRTAYKEDSIFFSGTVTQWRSNSRSDRFTELQTQQNAWLRQRCDVKFNTLARRASGTLRPGMGTSKWIPPRWWLSRIPILWARGVSFLLTKSYSSPHMRPLFQETNRRLSQGHVPSFLLDARLMTMVKPQHSPAEFMLGPIKKKEIIPQSNCRK